MADEEFMFGDLFATVRVQDLPASREVVAVERQENGTWRVCGSAIANTDGIAELGIEGSKTSRVYAFAIDHWGEPFTPNKTVAYGDIIRPSVFLGWLYRVTAPGVLPGEEPVWWNSTPGMPRPVGSAIAQAEMYFQPIAHGPVDIEWEVKEEGDPHWDKVVSLLHFDEDLSDSATGSWSEGSTVTTSQSVFGGGSLYVNGNTLPRDTAAPLLPLNDDFTFECFVMPISVGGYGGFVYSQDVNNGSARGANIIIGSAGQLLLSCVGYLELGEQSSGTIPYNEWTHIAATRESNIFRLFANGVIVDQKTYSGPLGSTDTIKPRIGEIALQIPSGTAYRGYIDELRITKGVARYTENFTPPTEPFPNFKRL